MYALRPLALLLALGALFCSLPTEVSAAAPTTSGECACLYLPQLDTFLYEKNATRRHSMASTTKIMTALVVIEVCAPDEVVLVPEEAVGIEGSSVYLKAGEEQTVGNLLYALMLASANDAAAALAMHVAGSIEAFAAKMNERAAHLGLRDTHFENPHGLDAEGHYTTAADLAKITAAAMELPLFREIVATRHKVIVTDDGAGARSLSNHNRLLRSYDGCVGVKTGYTKKTGRCLVSAAERDGMLLIAVTLDAPDDWRDHTALLDFGFSLYRGEVLGGDGGLSYSLPVLGGVSESVTLTAGEAQPLILPKNSPALERRVEINRFALAPVRSGEVLGRVVFSQAGRVVAELPLRACEDVPAREIKENLLDKIKKFFNL